MYTMLQTRRNLLNRFESAVLQREKPIAANSRISLERTISLNNRRTQYYRSESKKLRDRLSYDQRLSEQLIEETGVEVEINDDSDIIFNDDTADDVTAFLESSSDDDTAIAEYVFREHVAKYKQAKPKGIRTIRHSPLVIRLGIAVRKAMGYSGGLYDLLALG
jgi:hypothetical protein